ncbi:3'(2'),5'-bisphosphate nucleotidase [Thiovulum sp. ES]|nr:3'(2'),5'-bisphosphate nucleotidase [Thiovulum sp. ES]
MENINIDEVIEIAKKAGQKALEIYNSSFNIEYKGDGSPLTDADLEANKIITSSLKKLYPEIPILSEEGKDIPFEIRKNWELFWLVDPIDGTKEFINKSGEFTVNIALIQKHSPVLGVIYAPVLDKMYSAKKGNGAFVNGEKMPLPKTERPFTVVASKSHRNRETDEYLNTLKNEHENIEFISIGSSLKFCIVAEGNADLYPRFAPTMEWDTGAGDAIIREVGMKTLRIEDMKPVIYNKENLLNPYFIVK